MTHPTPLLLIASIVLPAAAWGQSEAPLARPGSQLLYGIAAVDLVHATNVYNGAVATSQYRVDNSTPAASRLGFRGAEDLGGGLSAVFGLEMGVSPDTGSTNATALFNRGSYVGVSSPTWGTLTLGRQWNLEDGILGRYFVFGGYAAFKYTEFVAIDDLVNNAVKYVSPTLGGVRVAALVAPGEGVGGKTLEGGLNYALGPFEVGGTYRRVRGANGQADTLASGGASLTVGTVRLHGGYSHADPKASALPEVNAVDAGIIWNVTLLFGVAYDYIGRNQLGTGNDSHFQRFQANYIMSPRTWVYANLVPLRNSGIANQRFLGTGAAGQSQTVFGVGIRHLF